MRVGKPKLTKANHVPSTLLTTWAGVQSVRASVPLCVQQRLLDSLKRRYPSGCLDIQVAGSQLRRNTRAGA